MCHLNISTKQSIFPQFKALLSLWRNLPEPQLWSVQRRGMANTTPKTEWAKGVAHILERSCYRENLCYGRNQRKICKKKCRGYHKGFKIGKGYLLPEIWSSVKLFFMQYENNVFNCILNRSITSWIFKMIFKLIFSDHCNIDLGNSFVITGGDPGTSTVSYYTSRGWVQDLAPMNTGRYAHGCSSFTNSNQQEVWIKYIMWCS